MVGAGALNAYYHDDRGSISKDTAHNHGRNCPVKVRYTEAECNQVHLVGKTCLGRAGAGVYGGPLLNSSRIRTSSLRSFEGRKSMRADCFSGYQYACGNIIV